MGGLSSWASSRGARGGCTCSLLRRSKVDDAPAAVHHPLIVPRRSRGRPAGRHAAAELGLERAERADGRGGVADDVGEGRVERPVRVAEQPAVVGVPLDKDQRRGGQLRPQRLRHLPHRAGLHPEQVLREHPAPLLHVAQPALRRRDALGALVPREARQVAQRVHQVLRQRVRHKRGVRLQLEHHRARGAALQQVVRQAQVRHQLKARVVHNDVHPPAARRLGAPQHLHHRRQVVRQQLRLAGRQHLGEALRRVAR
mmetsp:Transcript_39576/g.100378  ORF Transcript_39576/g.100378 Transcript_39576/m.100378 type:complete len:256 (-) Transcript_39576:543-1310(-)